MGKLTAKQVEHAKPGKHGDGDGLSLVVKASGRRSFVLRYRDETGKRRDTGLGAWPEVSLAQARRQAAVFRAEDAPAGPGLAGRTLTVRQAAKAVHDQLASTWRSGAAGKASRDYWARLDRFARPLLDMPCRRVTRADVLGCLLPIWATKTATARKLRCDLRRVLGYAMALDEGIASNAAGEGIEAALTRQPAVRSHHRAICHGEVAEALDILDRDSGTAPARLCLRFVVLTGARSGEARGATWAEIDSDMWTVPAARMKAGKPHRVPLSRQALDVLDDARLLDDGSGLVFPAPQRQRNRVLSGEALHAPLRRNMIDTTPHGFRTALRQWLAEQPGASWAAAEHCLAHTPGNAIAMAYLRDADLLAERRPLMQAWADYVAPAG